MKATRIDHGKASTPAPAVELARPVPSATGATTKTRRECRAAFAPCSTGRAGDISDRGWSRDFDDPIPVPRGRQLVTLRNAAIYITKLPRAEHDAPEWQAAMEALLLVAELGGPTMFARIGVMRALNRHVERVFNADRKETRWGKRKLARDR